MALETLESGLEAQYPAGSAPEPPHDGWPRELWRTLAGRPPS